MTKFDIHNTFKMKNKSNEDFIFLIFILLLPFMFFAYNFVPSEKTWKTLFFQIESGHYDNVKEVFWYLSIKLLTLGILSLWYLTCIHKWRNLIFFPIIIEFSKIIFLIKSISENIYNQVFVTESFLFSIPFIFLLFSISKRLSFHKKSQNYKVELNKQINEEFLKLSRFNKNDYKIVKNELIKIVDKKNKISQKEYLIKLIALKDRLTN